MEDDSGCMVEQQDTDSDRILPMDQITETEAEMYQIPGKDQPWRMMWKQSAQPPWLTMTGKK